MQKTLLKRVSHTLFHLFHNCSGITPFCRGRNQSSGSLMMRSPELLSPIQFTKEYLFVYFKGGEAVVSNKEMKTEVTFSPLVSKLFKMSH